MPTSSKTRNLDRLFLSRIRLGIMSALADGDPRDFSLLKSLLECTDGNLGAHLQKLERAGMIRANKRFVSGKPNTSYVVTKLGSRKFSEYVKGLAGLLGLK